MLNRHKYYDTLNLIGYGLSKFDKLFVNTFGFSTKSAFYKYIVEIGIAETIGVVKNRQDLFDGMTEHGKRKGWWQKGAVYKHRRDYIDSLFGMLNTDEYVEIVKLSIADAINDTTIVKSVRPILCSRFKQMQETGQEAEYYFLNNFKEIDFFSNASIDDARLLGDGYDFQITLPNKYYLIEVKGIRTEKGYIRMTKNEFEQASTFKNDYVLIIVCNLDEIPRMIPIFNPINHIRFERKNITSKQIYYHSKTNVWNI